MCTDGAETFGYLICGHFFKHKSVIRESMCVTFDNLSASYGNPIGGHFLRGHSLSYKCGHCISHAHTHIQDIGASAQGFCNAILFCLFTKLVREKLVSLLKCRPCRRLVRELSSLDCEETSPLTSESRSLLNGDPFPNGGTFDKSLQQKGKGTDIDSD